MAPRSIEDHLTRGRKALPPAVGEKEIVQRNDRDVRSGASGRSLKYLGELLGCPCCERHIVKVVRAEHRFPGCPGARCAKPHYVWFLKLRYSKLKVPVVTKVKQI